MSIASTCFVLMFAKFIRFQYSLKDESPCDIVLFIIYMRSLAVVENLGKKRQPLPALDAIYFIRPSQDKFVHNPVMLCFIGFHIKLP